MAGVSVVVALTIASSGQAQIPFNSATMGNRARIRSGRPTFIAATGATAAVTKPISIVRTRDLGFGYVIAGATEGTVVVPPIGPRSVTGGAALGPLGDAGAAMFTVSGDALASYRIMLPNRVNLASGNDHMFVVDFTSSPSEAGLLDDSGQQVLRVGATLEVGAHQAPGFYEKEFQVTVVHE